ncbi:cytochrome c [Stieleria sp. TO1_6]|uniref:cytochrome c n=1 Tax=Stieleria tagensis TaxID=2956795 RepID=UPI00209B68EB|nr:cytochrome c [Stieleria tagensis]MCO8123362.1 cytochrome c [Stieleria tagensis]
MKTNRFALTLGMLLVPAIASLIILTRAPIPATFAQAPSVEPSNELKSELVPVEGDMHEFMEYVFQPTYKRLKESMAISEKDNANWKSIKSDSLILAEGGNLLLFRGSASESQDWNQHATTVRKFGGQLYQAAKQKNQADSEVAYRTMIQNCNACHQDFADGEHQLAP